MDGMPFLISRRTFIAGAIGAMVVGCKGRQKAQVAATQQCPTVTATRPGLHIDLIVDRTTAFAKEVAGRLVSALEQQVKPGDTVRITKFAGRQADLISIPEVISIGGTADVWTDSANAVRRAKECEQQSHEALKRTLQNTLADYDGARDGSSPIFEALARIAESWTRSAKEHLCILCSDGVAHSPAVDFIAKGSGALALPTPQALQTRLRDLGLMPRGLDGVRVIHVGFGSGDGTAQQRRLRPATEIAALRRLWLEGYWNPCGVRTFQFGTPLPLGHLVERQNTRSE